MNDLVREAQLPLDGLAEAAQVFVAVRGGRIIGVAALEDHSDANGRAFLLRSVTVAPDARAAGVGAALVRTALRSAEQHGAPIALLTETAADYFPRFGFEATERSDLPSALHASKELQGACGVSAHALVYRPPTRARCAIRRGRHRAGASLTTPRRRPQARISPACGARSQFTRSP